MTVREELIALCREAAQATRIASWTLPTASYGHGYLVALSDQLRAAVARAEAEGAVASNEAGEGK